MKDLMKALRTKRALSTVYYLQTNSQMKQINQEVKMLLRHYVNYQQNNWKEWLSAAEFQYNDKKYTAIGHTPFELNFGRHPWKGNMTIRTELPKLNNFLEGLQRSWDKARILMDIAKEIIKK